MFVFHHLTAVSPKVYIVVYRPDPAQTIPPCTGCNIIFGGNDNAQQANKAYPSSKNDNFFETTQGIVVLIVAVVSVVLVALVTVWFSRRKEKIHGHYSNDLLVDNDQLSRTSSAVSA